MTQAQLAEEAEQLGEQVQKWAPMTQAQLAEESALWRYPVNSWLVVRTLTAGCCRPGLVLLKAWL
jgi:hypothetical protein